MCRYEMFHIDTKEPGNAMLATLGTGPSEQYPASATTLGALAVASAGRPIRLPDLRSLRKPSPVKTL